MEESGFKARLEFLLFLPPTLAPEAPLQAQVVGLEVVWGKVTCPVEDPSQSQGLGVVSGDGSSQTRTAGHTSRSNWHFLGRV